jgi:hypothetical protein
LFWPSDLTLTRNRGEEGADSLSELFYIHGTPQERSIGKAISYGCVRMRSRDIIQIFDAVPVGTPVTIITKKLPRIRKPEPFKLVVSMAYNRSRGAS